MTNCCCLHKSLQAPSQKHCQQEDCKQWHCGSEGKDWNSLAPIPFLFSGHQCSELKVFYLCTKTGVKTRNPLTHLNAAGILGILRKARIVACSLPAILGDFLLLACLQREDGTAQRLLAQEQSRSQGSVCTDGHCKGAYRYSCLPFPQSNSAWHWGCFCQSLSENSQPHCSEKYFWFDILVLWVASWHTWQRNAHFSRNDHIIKKINKIVQASSFSDF